MRRSKTMVNKQGKFPLPHPVPHPVAPAGNRFALPVDRCKGVGPKLYSLLSRLNIHTVEDLLHHAPRSYLDRRDITNINKLEASRPAVVVGEVIAIRRSRPSRRFRITECAVRDDSGVLKAVWFNQPYVLNNILKGERVILSGMVSFRNGLQMENPDIEALSEESGKFLHTMAIIPVYPLTQGLGQKTIRRIIRAALDDFLNAVPEPLPDRMRKSHGLLSKKEALRAIHFPQSESDVEAARRALVFEEFAALQVNLLFHKSKDTLRGIAFPGPATLTKSLDERLPFQLTASQAQAKNAIFQRMESPAKMNALLQGDVGSGKTIVAVYAMLKALENGKQAALMAPTEILAEQHFSRLRRLVEGLGIRLALLTGSQPARERKQSLALLGSGSPCLIIGTHALIGERVAMPAIGLVIVDEQHRFGVSQRAALVEKGLNPDLLVMTATPIPRTLALTLYADFDVIVIDQYPQGRALTETSVGANSRRAAVFALARNLLKEGRQAFVVCPEIGEAEPAKTGGLSTVRRAYESYSKWFAQWKVGCLHGKMDLADRESILDKFRENSIQVLVTTTVIEVGVDVPNATVMIVEGADRFGLTQLHQLRGRVGRSIHKSYCFLFVDSPTPQAAQRLSALETTRDGFAIAEQDLLLRGPGEFFGTAQAGLPRLRIGRLLQDMPLLQEAREEVQSLLKADPLLETAENRPLRELVIDARSIHL